MKFFILGDSYGIGEWKQTSPGFMEAVPDTGLDYYLQQLGHIVTNVSAGSSCNFGQLRHAYWKLRENSDYDYIIWFHTEPVRDIIEHVLDNPADGQVQYPNFQNIKDYTKAMDYINDCNYKFAQDRIYDEFNIPWIVIGGVGRLGDSINDYSFPAHKIYSWIEDILELDYTLPKNLLLWQRSIELFDNFKYDSQEILTELEISDNYQKLLKQSILFPDDCHVIRTEYEKLAHRLLKML